MLLEKGSTGESNERGITAKNSLFWNKQKCQQMVKSKTVKWVNMSKEMKIRLLEVCWFASWFERYRIKW